MKTKIVGTLLFVVAHLLLTAPPALAGYECSASLTDGDSAAYHEVINARHMDRLGEKLTTVVGRVIHLNFSTDEDRRIRLRRSFFIHYSGTRESPWNVEAIGFNYHVRVKEPNRPFFGFLILDSGEYIERLVVDAKGRDRSGNKGPFKVVGFSPHHPRREHAFLDALRKASVLAFELKYPDGETLARETFDLRPTDTMQRTLASALEMKDCKYWKDVEEVEQ